MGTKRPLTILHLDGGRELRGGQWQLLRLLRGLRKRGHHNLLLARADSPLLEYGQRERFKCDSLQLTSVRWTSGMADIVHAHDARGHTMAALWSKQPFVVSAALHFR